MTTAVKRRYRHLPPDDDGKRQRVMVVLFKGWEGYVVRWTDYCSGCTEHGDYGTRYGPFGCEECGYTGKRRREEWVPFDGGGYYEYRNEVWRRYERFCGYVRNRAEARA